jgi:hypothetical protein
VWTFGRMSVSFSNKPSNTYPASRGAQEIACVANTPNRSERWV